MLFCTLGGLIRMGVVPVSVLPHLYCSPLAGPYLQWSYRIYKDECPCIVPPCFYPISLMPIDIAASVGAAV